MSTIAFAFAAPLKPDGQSSQGSIAGKTVSNPDDPNRKKPTIETYVDILAALVPAEVLSLHALFVSVTVETVGETTALTHRDILAWGFVGLILLSIALYVFPRLLATKGKWEIRDYFRSIIPPLSFLGWTMIQKATAFDAVVAVLAEWQVKGLVDPNDADAARMVVALFLAVILAGVAGFLEYKLPKK